MPYIPIANEKNPIECANLIAQCKKGESQLTPDFCMEMLASTNNPRIILDMLNLIGDPTAYKDVVLSAIERRQQPLQILARVAELADKGGYLKEANALFLTGSAPVISTRGSKIPGASAKNPLDKSSPRCVKYNSSNDSEQLTISKFDGSVYDGLLVSPKAQSLMMDGGTLPPCLDLTPYKNLRNVCFYNMDLASANVVFPLEIENVEIYKCINVMPQLNFSGITSLKRIAISTADLTNTELTLPPFLKELYLSSCRLSRNTGLDFSSQAALAKLHLNNSNFNGAPIVFPKYVKELKMENVSGLPGSISLKDCLYLNSADFSRTDFLGIQMELPGSVSRLMFKECETLPSKLYLKHLTHAQTISFANSNLLNCSLTLPPQVEELTFDNAKNLPDALEINARTLNASYTSLRHTTLTFKEDVVNVKFYKSKLPEKMDLSLCKNLGKGCEFHTIEGLKEIIFPPHVNRQTFSLSPEIKATLAGNGKSTPSPAATSAASPAPAAEPPVAEARSNAFIRWCKNKFSR